MPCVSEMNSDWSGRALSCPKPSGHPGLLSPSLLMINPPASPMGSTCNPYLESDHFLKLHLRASLVAQWLRIRLLMQGTRVQALLWEDPTCRGATKPVRHNY